MHASRARTFVLPGLAVLLLGGMVGAAVAHATCDPTTDPDKTDVANARAAVASNCTCTGARGAYLSCAAQQADQTLVNKSCAAAVRRCAAHSTCGKPAGAVTCCVSTLPGTKCKTKRDAAHCRAPVGGTACVGSFTSCCDACGAGGCVTTTSTTIPGVCGDGIINQASEECDGEARGDGCLLPVCGRAGGPTACRCCLPDGATHPGFGIALPCCGGGFSGQIAPNAVACFNNSGTCAPPDVVCPLGTCQADHSCCAAQGTQCLLFYTDPLFQFGAAVECCAGSACRTFGPSGPPGSIEGHCCLQDAATCTADTECCTGHCTAGACDQCRAPGTACASNGECCSSSGCVSGVCGACGNPGAVCTDGVQCCSGTCNGTSSIGPFRTCQ